MDLVGGLKRRAQSVPWRIASDLAQRPMIHTLRTRRYDASVALHRPALPRLTPAQDAILAEVDQRGVSQRDIATLGIPGSGAMLLSAADLAQAWADRLRARGREGIDFLYVPADEIARHPEIYRFGLDAGLLDLVEAYIGLPIAYDGVTLQYTVADGRPVSTRKWHRDREDRRMVKMAIYLTDVDAAGGPFQLLPILDPASYETGPRDMFYLREADEVEQDGCVLGTRPISCEGPAGTAVFADTARFFHRGKPATGNDRAALFFSYFARIPERPFFCYRSGLSYRQIAAMTDDLSPRQRAAALWRQTLPLPWRLIPPSAV
ncbi:hypothetical protein [Sphingomonas sp. TREG-RG-20F-R18-01]|uniref:hypothetical protein n=1 Tax=Sphingomonas sp. TREG-RG-20F-R18-01 TaxID=2914982 RepID=UPI001F56677E|nr:hypothetical protein [Sphingomonas sp. TREG-RG-20F-R18-01]